MFGFDPDVYEFGEDSGTNPVAVSLLSGSPGGFTVVLTAGADESSTIDTATGTYISKDIGKPYLTIQS